MRLIAVVMVIALAVVCQAAVTTEAELIQLRATVQMLRAEIERRDKIIATLEAEVAELKRSNGPPAPAVEKAPEPPLALPPRPAPKPATAEPLTVEKAKLAETRINYFDKTIRITTGSRPVKRTAGPDWQKPKDTIILSYLQWGATILPKNIQGATLHVHSEGEWWSYKPAPSRATFFLDEASFSIPVKDFNAQRGGLRGAVETFALVLPADRIVAIGRASKVRLKIGEVELEFPERVIQSFTHFAVHLGIDNEAPTKKVGKP